MYVTIENNGKAYVKRQTDVNKDEHVSGVFNDCITACNVARKVARQCGLEYIPLRYVNNQTKILKEDK